MTCPGPDRASECENFGCRRNGCFGRMPDRPQRIRRAVYAGTSREQMAAMVADTPPAKPGDRAKLYGKV